MSIQSNFEYKGSTYEKVTFKIVRVFGSKAEGWNAVFAFVVDGDEFVESNYKGLISVGAEWVDGNPYPILYRRMEKILSDGGFEVWNDEEDRALKDAMDSVQKYLLEAAAEQDSAKKDEPVVEEPKPKKTRTKKVKKDVGNDSK